MIPACGLRYPRRRFYLLFLWIALLLLVSACGNDNSGNEITVGAPSGDGDPISEFANRIIPIFERRCSVACHGVDKDSYENFLEKDPINAIAFYFPYDPETGKIQADDVEQVYKVAVAHDRINYAEQPRFSPLLRAPLAEEYGGMPHRGLDVFYSSDDKDFQVMKEWLADEIAAHREKNPPPQENVAYFQQHILGLMERNSCFLSSCHGSQVFNDLKLVPPLPSDDIGTETAIESGFSRQMVLANRAIMLGKVSRLVNLGGDLKQSRVIVKNLPISEGGIHQRGGNRQFFESFQDQDVKHIVHWLELERKALAGHLTSEGAPIDEGELGKVRGMVFIRGPRHTPRNWFSFDEFYPGSDIFLLPLRQGETLADASATPINITAPFHDSPVEIQSLDVRYDMKRIVFSMRSEGEKGFRLYELELDDGPFRVIGKPRQISFAAATLDDGTVIHHIDPVYMPGPEDKAGHELGEVAIAFASNESGQYAQSDLWGILGEADGGSGTTLLDRQRPEAPGTFTGRRIVMVAGPNKGEWRTIVAHQAISGKGSGARLELDRPLPNKLDRDTVYVIEKDGGAVRSSYDIWRFVPESVAMDPHGGGHEPEQAAELSPRQRFHNTRHQMTYSYAQERRPSARTSGETMLTSVRNIGYQGDKPVFNGAIYRLQAGGFDYHIQGGNRSRYPLYSDSRELGNGLEVRLAHDPRNLWSGGLLVLADHGFGINLESDNPVDDNPYSVDVDADASGVVFSSPPRFISAQVNLFDEQGELGITHTGVSPGGSARDPYPLLNGSLVTSFTARELDHLDPNADPDWDLYLLEFVKSPHREAGDKAGALRRLKISAASSELAEYSPRPLMLRLKEKAERPIHHQKFGSRALTTPPIESNGFQKMPDGLPGEVECYDYPLLQSFLTNFAPTGAKDFHIQQGNPDGSRTADDQLFKYVRVIMQLPTSKQELQPINTDFKQGDPFADAVSSGVHTRRVIVAEAPIEDDGSFYLEVPSKVPLILQGLNGDRMALHSMNRWFYLQPGEKLTFGIPRSIFPLRCAGCHGSLSGDPFDGIGPVDLVSASSRVMATWNKGEQRRRVAYGFDHAGDETIGIDFHADVQPILNHRCRTCHQSETGPAGLDLRDIETTHYNRAYESLHQLRDPASGNYADKRYINEREALSSESRLVQSLIGKQGRQHLQGEALSDDEMLTLVRWIDLGATYKGGMVQ